MVRTGSSVIITIRLDDLTVETLDSKAVELEINRSELIRKILRKEVKRILHFRGLSTIPSKATA